MVRMPPFIVYQGHQWSVDEFRKYVGDPGPHLRSFFVTGSSKIDKEVEASKSAHLSSGTLYLLAHKSDRVVKVGLTKNSTLDRLNDYVRRHRLSGSWRVYREWIVADVAKIEKRAMAAFRSYRISKRSKELFACSPEEAVEKIDDIIEHHV
jgi:hypothetical protein